jgi:hypothetical protein
VKCALALLGRIEETYRLPLCETSEKVKAQLRLTLQNLQMLPPTPAAAEKAKK